ncbi:MAG: DedA family protein [Candidatus Nanopelagicales bacterium]|jgi:membrane protein DedA with SNARE-associated domain|nr:DedA family protein [Candidatus Nanopelagicales bacterium]
MRQVTSEEGDLGLVGFILDTIDTLGEVGVGLLVLLESVIPPIPSEVVLPAAGALVELGRLNGPLTWLCALLGSVLGALLLYGAGRAFGEERTRRVLLAVPLVESDDVDRADAWFARRGEMAVFVGRLIPGVRSLVSLPAGAAAMPLGRFIVLTTAGSAIWNSLLIGAGVLLGTQWQVVEEHIDVINDLIYITIGVALGVFFMRRWAHRRRQAGAGDA